MGKRTAFLAALLAGLTSAAEGQTSRTQVVLLGTGAPFPLAERSGPATAIVVNGIAYLVDLGPGVVRRARAANDKGIEALEPRKIKYAFITHLHSDHTLGYPDLIFTPWVVGRKEPITVFGPPGLTAMTNQLLAAWSADIEMRNEGMEASFPEHSHDGYKVNAQEISPGIVYRDANVTVTAFTVKHGEWGDRAFGYRFQTPDKVIVISGDTSPSENVVRQCAGCDILIHEVYAEAGNDKASDVWKQYNRAYHTSTRQLAVLANQAKPKLLILYHERYSEADILREMGQYYPGRWVYGRDLEVY